MASVATDNQFADWFSGAQRGAAACYYEYGISAGKLLCDARRADPVLEALATKAWNMYEAGCVALHQVRDRNSVRYIAVKR